MENNHIYIYIYIYTHMRKVVSVIIAEPAFSLKCEEAV